MTPQQFDAALQGKRVTPDVRKALRMIKVDGKTWREAVLKTGVYESSILRAMRRVFPDDEASEKAPLRIRLAPGERFLTPAYYTATLEGEVGAIVRVTGPNKAVLVRRVVASTST